MHGGFRERRVQLIHLRLERVGQLTRVGGQKDARLRVLLQQVLRAVHHHHGLAGTGTTRDARGARVIGFDRAALAWVEEDAPLGKGPLEDGCQLLLAGVDDESPPASWGLDAFHQRPIRACLSHRGLRQAQIFAHLSRAHAGQQPDHRILFPFGRARQRCQRFLRCGGALQHRHRLWGKTEFIAELMLGDAHRIPRPHSLTVRCGMR